MITQAEQYRFYEGELDAFERKVKENFESPARYLFNKGDLFIAQFKGYDAKRGNIFFDIKGGEGYHIPRIEQVLNCFRLKPGRVLPTEWGSISYRELISPLNFEAEMSECKLVNFTSSERKGWIKMVVSSVEIEFAKTLKINDILGFGPTLPPIEYLKNLSSFTVMNDGLSALSKSILNFEYTFSSTHSPILITEEIDIAQRIINETEINNIFVFQGPPGTGKTHQIADVIQRLAKNGKSILLTALTNKAAVEVCEKPFLNELMEKGKVFKTSLSSKELNDFPLLRHADELMPIKGEVILSTYYQFSKIWETCFQDFDYVIVEEASQAFLTTIAAAAQVGKKVIVVGDPFQILPIVTGKRYKRISDNIDLLVNGLQTLCTYDQIPQSRKVESRRLTARSVDYTNVFYQNSIESKSLVSSLELERENYPILKNAIHNLGGPALLLFDNNNFLKTAADFLIKAIRELKGNRIAILTPFSKKSLVFLQKKILPQINQNDLVLDTVDRVQGLDVDYCFYVIPPNNYRFSFNLNRFNVATSRAKKSTFILIENDFTKKCMLRKESGEYLTRLLKEFAFDVNGLSLGKLNHTYNNEESTKNIGTENYDEIYDLLVEKQLIEEDGFFNSVTDKKGNIVAEAEFVFTFEDKTIVVEPFSEEDSKAVNSLGYEILLLNEVKQKIQ